MEAIIRIAAETLRGGADHSQLWTILGNGEMLDEFIQEGDNDTNDVFARVIDAAETANAAFDAAL